MKFTFNRVGRGGKADYIVSQLRIDVDWVHFDDRRQIVDEINSLRYPNLKAVLITHANTLADGIHDLLQDRKRQQRVLDASISDVVAAVPSVNSSAKCRRLNP